MSEIKTEINSLQSLLLSEETLAVEICETDIDFSNICRTCLRETDDNDLTNDALCIINANGKLVSVYQMFEAVTGLKIESNDRLPHHLCSTCLKFVNNSYTFRVQSQRADEILQSIVGNIKEEPEDEPGEETQLEDDFAEEEEEQEDLETTRELDVIEGISPAGEYEDDIHEILDVEVMDIEQLDEISGTDEVSEQEEIFQQEVSGSGNDFACPFCTKVFCYQRDIIQHYKDKHPKEKPFKCNECSASFAHIQSMRRHKNVHGTGFKKKLCAVCCRTFHRSDDLKRHIRTHTDERPYSCPKCLKAFKQHSELKDHMLSHTDRKMYKCTLCSKEWRSRNGCYLHMKAYHMEKDVHRKKTKKKTKGTTDGELVAVEDVLGVAPIVVAT